MIWEQVVMA